MKNDPLIKLKNITLKATHRCIIEDVSFNLTKNSITTILGHNGAGKSTIAKIILGITKASQGTVNIKPNLTFAYLPQKLHLEKNFPLTVKRFISLPNKVSKHDLEVVARQTGIYHLQNAQMFSLSGGELQRVLLTRAILRKPDIYILDEPIQNIDSTGQIELYHLIKELRDQQGASILLISHDIDSIVNISDHIIFLDQGRIYFEGSPDEFKKYHHICTHCE